MRLHASVLEPCPSTIHILVLPLHLVHHICWHAQNSGRTNIAMVVCLHHYVLAHHSVFYNERSLVGQGKVSLSVIRVHDMGTTAVLKCLCFLPVHQFVVFDAVMAGVLEIAGTVMTNECVAIIDVIDEGSRKSLGIAVGIKGVAQRLIDIVSVIGGRLVRHFGIIESKGVSIALEVKENIE